MPTPEFTVEDQLVSDLVVLWSATLPADLPAGLAIIHFRRTTERPMPHIMIGHEGAARETAKGMTGTGRVNLRLAVVTDLDATTADSHRAIAAAADRAVTGLSTGPGPMALTYLHAILREPSTTVVQDRRQITLLSYQAIATRCTSA